ncbi:MAG: hypothetical protein ACOC9W_04015, partial [Persicimonas sp.]
EGTQLVWWHVGLLLVVTGAIYHGAPDFGFFPNWDDSRYLLDRVEVRDWFAASWSERLLTPEVGYPLPLPTFVYYLLGHLPAEWVVPVVHLVSLAFHALNVVLVYLLAARWLGKARLGAVAAALWASHPLLVESVAWATNLKTVTFAAFFLASLWIFDEHLRRPRKWLAAGAVVLFVLALGCRPEGVIAAPAWLGLSLWRRPERLREPLVWGAIALGAVLAAIYVPVGVLGHDALMHQDPVQRHLKTGLSGRLWEVGVALGMQLRHVAWPVDLHPSYGPKHPAASIDFAVGCAAAIVLLSSLVWSGLRRSNIAVGLGLFWLAYLPASGVTFLPRFTADTYMYVPLAGLSLAAVATASALGRRIGARLRRYGWLIAALGVIYFSALAYAQTLRWHNELTLWEPTMEDQPYLAQTYWMVGEAYASVERWEEAARVYKQGYPRLVKRQRIPLRMVDVLRRVDQPNRAARVAATVATYEGIGRRAAGRELLALLVAEDIDPGADPVVREALGEITARGLDTYDLDVERFGASEAVELAERAAASNLEAVAAELLRYGLEIDQQKCAAWKLLGALDAEHRRHATGGRTRPERCR